MSGLDNAWLPYYCKVKILYLKIEHLDDNKKIIKKLNRVYKLGGIVPLFTTYNELDEIKKDIGQLKSKL